MGHLTPSDVDVLIVGAGPTGLAMAAEAARFGLSYRVIDKAPHGAVHSQALIVQPRTLEQFERYEIAQTAIELGRRLGRIRIYSDGDRVLESSLDELGGSYPFVLFLPQPQTERLLHEHLVALGGMVEREVTLEYFEERGDTVECVLLGKSGARDTVSAAYLIGADGSQSTVREILGVPVESRGQRLDVLSGDLRVDGDVPGDELDLHMHRGNLVLVGRIDDTYCRFLVARSQTSQPLQPRLADFQDAIDDAGIENLRVSDPRWMGVLGVNEQHAPAYARGRVFLAGDATTVHSPIGGQGMNMGIGDAENLLWKIALTLRGHGGATLLNSYELERAPLADAVRRGTSVPLQATTAPNWLLERVRQGILLRIGPSLNYRTSPIVRDCGGTGMLAAGDRAIDCEVVDESGARFRLFERFKEPVHTAVAVSPHTSNSLEAFTQIARRHAAILQAMVITGGDAQLRQTYGENSLYVVRPDGYVGFRGSMTDLQALPSWLESLFTASAPDAEISD